MQCEVEPGNALVAAMIKCRPNRVCNCAHVHVGEVLSMIESDAWHLRSIYEAITCSANSALFLYLFWAYDSGDEIMIAIDCTEFDRPRVKAIYTADVFVKGHDDSPGGVGRLMTITQSDRANLSYGPRDLTAWAMSTQQTIGGVHAKIKAHRAASDQQGDVPVSAETRSNYATSHTNVYQGD